ncbi:hypothetical protein AAFF_G00100460 [Aldrovandia affinis]|uniref:Uncharacterized protein n=1 Tax=Aldrovandia affinis TaxID=143900 RepID=A0AAD7RX78_9TELE|nr:hypothetical protein AAFF_G00100460 [Aldrovandia affinis]
MGRDEREGQEPALPPQVGLAQEGEGRRRKDRPGESSDVIKNGAQCCDRQQRRLTTAPMLPLRLTPEKNLQHQHERLLGKFICNSFRVTKKCATAWLHVSLEMVKPENDTVVEEKTKKRKKQLPVDERKPKTEGKTEKVKKKKKGTKAAAAEVTNDEDVSVLKEEFGVEVTKGKKKRKTEEPPGEGDQDPVSITSGKAKKRKKGGNGEEKNLGSAESDGVADVTIDNREGKTAAKTGNGKRKVSSDVASNPTNKVNGEKKRGGRPRKGMMPWLRLRMEDRKERKMRRKERF